MLYLDLLKLFFVEQPSPIFLSFFRNLKFKVVTAWGINLILAFLSGKILKKFVFENVAHFMFSVNEENINQ